MSGAEAFWGRETMAAITAASRRRQPAGWWMSRWATGYRSGAASWGHRGVVHVVEGVTQFD